MYESDVWYFKFKPIQKCMFPVSWHAIQLSNVSIFVQFLNCGSVSFGRAVTTNFYWFFLSSISCERCKLMQFLHTTSICYMHEKSYLDPFFGQCFSIRHHQQYPIRHGNSIGVTWIGPSEHSMKSQQLNMFMAFARLASWFFIECVHRHLFFPLNFHFQTEGRDRSTFIDTQIIWHNIHIITHYNNSWIYGRYYVI